MIIISTGFEALLQRLPKLLANLREAQPYNLDDLTRGRVRRILTEIGTSVDKVAGLYVFSTKKDGRFDYVGRTRDLAQRLGNQHRPIERFGIKPNEESKRVPFC